MPIDFSDIRGQEAVKRAMCIALAGKHSIGLIGPHGHGKTMLIEAAQAIAPITANEFGVSREESPADKVRKQEYLAGYDMHVEVPAVPFRELVGKNKGTSSARIREQLTAMTKHESLEMSDSCLCLAKQAYNEIGLTPRSYHIALRIARTIANLDQSPKIAEMHFAEAIQYRLMDRKF